MKDLSPEQAELILKTAKRAARHVSSVEKWHREELEGELIMFAFDNPKEFKRYLRADISQENAQQALIGTFSNVGRKILRRNMRPLTPVASLSERLDEGSSLERTSVVMYTLDDIRALLKYIDTPDAEVPAQWRESVSIFRSEVHTLTPRQRLVLKRWGSGEKQVDIARSLGITRQSVHDLKSRALEVLQSRPIFSKIPSSVSTSP